jgi:hypothetical protein
VFALPTSPPVEVDDDIVMSTSTSPKSDILALSVSLNNPAAVGEPPTETIYRLEIV